MVLKLRWRSHGELVLCGRRACKISGMKEDALTLLLCRSPSHGCPLPPPLPPPPLSSMPALTACSNYRVNVPLRGASAGSSHVRLCVLDIVAVLVFECACVLLECCAAQMRKGMKACYVWVGGRSDVVRSKWRKRRREVAKKPPINYKRMPE